MLECWTLREEIYHQHQDYLLWAKDTNAMESWMSSREPHIIDSNYGQDIDEVEELLKKHKDFEGAVLAKEGDLQTVHRITMIEKNFEALREREEAARQEELRRREQERLEGLKKKELARITNERRRENERRRTQEIKFNREDFEQMRSAGSGGHVTNGKSDASKSVSPTNEMEAFRRGESLRMEPQKHKRTPSFTTRRRTQSFRRHVKNISGHNMQVRNESQLLSIIRL